jgi:hypothetical protein
MVGTSFPSVGKYILARGEGKVKRLRKKNLSVKQIGK